MDSLTIGWEYLTGYAVAATRPGGDPEWPPHPVRVFMALAAAWFETEPPSIERRRKDEWDREGTALRWLETLVEPLLLLPPEANVFERSTVTMYLPVNDKPDAHSQPDKKKKAKLFPYLGSVPIGRNRQPRTFPRVWVGSNPCFLHWPNAEGDEQHGIALERVCRKVTRIGHSSSLVRMWLADDGELDRSDGERLVVDDLMADVQVRSISVGMLDTLIERFGDGPRRRFMELNDKIDELRRRLAR